MRLILVFLLVFALLSGVGAFAQNEGVSTSPEQDLAQIIEELGQGLVIEEGAVNDEEGAVNEQLYYLLVVNQNTQEVLWKVIYEDTDGDGTFSPGDEILSLVNPAGKEIPVFHLVSPLRNRLRERIEERLQNQEEVQTRERVRNQERAQDRIQERTRNEEETQTQERVQNQEKIKNRPRPKEKRSSSK